MGRESSGRRILDFRRMLHSASGLAGRDGITTALTALLLSRVILLGEIAPFGIAYLAAVRTARPRFTPAAFLGLTAGLLTARPLLWALEGFGLALVVCWLVGFPPALAARKAGRVFAVSAMVLIAGLAVGAAGLILSGVSPLGLARVALEAGLASIFAAVALDALPILYPRGVPGTSGQRLSALVLFAVAFEGMGEWDVGFVQPSRVAGSVVILLTALAGGGPAGAVAGLTMGIMAMMASARPSADIVAVFGTGGLLAGALKPAGRLAVGAGYLIGCLILAPLTPDAASVLMVLAPAGAGVMLFLALPRQPLQSLAGWVTGDACAGECETSATREARPQPLAALAELAAGVSRALKDSDPAAADYLADTFARILARTCEKCTSRGACWGRDFCRTHHAFHALLIRAEETGELTAEHLPSILRRRCSRAGELLQTVSLVLELQRQEDYWRRRTRDGLDLLGSLLDGVARSASRDPSPDRRRSSGTPTWDLHTEAALGTALHEMNFRTVSLRRLPDELSMEVVAERCPGFDWCRKQVAPMARQILRRATMVERGCEWLGDGLRCRFVLTPAPGLTFRAGAARLPKHAGEVPGDSVSIKVVTPGRLLLALSNGMGAGAGAAKESQAALDLLEMTLKAGFTSASVVRVLNSFMVFRNPAESFATLDVTLVDLDAGDAELVKVGACPTLLRRSDGEVLVLGGGSPPLGILSRIEPRQADRDLRPGDLLVMVTDGVADPGKLGRRPDWLGRWLERPPSLEPQVLAQLILEAARGVGGTGDDMTALVATFSRRPSGQEEGGGEAEDLKPKVWGGSRP
ncbi:MAG TPA: SpoIIE family protein phosphatase [Bacillota bacterium]|nr:SpoIIE family protein phosphatase [Bacillota bacterium]